MSQSISMINVPKKDIGKKHLEWRVDIISKFVLTIPGSNWCRGWYVMWLFSYIGYRFVVALNDRFVIKAANLIDEHIFFFPRSASSLSIDKIPDR